MGVEHLDHRQFERLYGSWAPRTPKDVQSLLAGYPGRWWVAGGWAIEAFTGVSRAHDDIDPSVLRSDLPLLRRHLAGHLDVWAASGGALSPMLPDDNPHGAADEVLPADCSQVWTRPSASGPWEFDVLLDAGTADEWVYKRDPRIRMPMSEALWESDGILFIQPEIQLLYKAKGRRAKDQADFDTTLPRLDDHRRHWLADALDRTIPEHPWATAARKPA